MRLLHARPSTTAALIIALVIVAAPQSASADPSWGNPNCGAAAGLCIDAYRPGYIGQISVRVYHVSGGADVWYRIDGGSTWHWAFGDYANAQGYFAGGFWVAACAYSTVTVKATGWGGGQSDTDFVYSIC
jgi:hypothetical protein